jgi:hypothetical protein
MIRNAPKSHVDYFALIAAYPTFVEAANLWSGGPAQPEECQTSHMWELQPHQSMEFDAMMNPHAQKGRPMIITETGFGSTVGEATFSSRGVEPAASCGTERSNFSGARRGSAGIGLGEEERRQHVSTGMSYEQKARSVLPIFAEFRDDLAAMVFEKTGKRLDFNRWTGQSPDSWWTDAFMWSMLTNPTAPPGAGHPRQAGPPPAARLTILPAHQVSR